ncbi:DMT family transporter [Patescibacteria group bacterium]|nr:DMT family transporter [Patescibacteria group bacterium]MBU4016617.1 DMT family transporter [Patescibacteria group bacterium]MBU4098378.1 DMT family transporter [Patescibacteria group bacterium]
MWQGLMLIAIICLSVGRLMQRGLLRDGKHDPVTYSIYFQFIVPLIILPIALLNNFTMPPLSVIWPQFILMTVLYGTASVLFYLALKHTPISEVMVIGATGPIWTTITSILFLGDKISFLKIIGVLLAVIGVAFVFYQKGRFRFHKGHFYAFLSILFFGIGLTNDSFLLRYFNQITYSFLYYFFPGLFITLIYPKKVLEIKGFIRKNASFSFFLPAFLAAIGSLLVNTSFRIGAEASQVSTMMQLSPIFTIAVAAIFLGERENLIKKMVGGVIVVTGVLMI